MNPTDFPQANRELGRPPSMNDEECKPIRVFFSPPGSDALIHAHFTSRWMPTPEERRALVAGAPVWLRVLGSMHQPVALEVEPDWPEAQEPHAMVARNGLTSLLSMRDRWEFAAKHTPSPDRAQALRQAAEELDRWIADGIADLAESVRAEEAETLAAAGLPGPDPILDLGDEGDAPAPAGEASRAG